MSLSFIQAGQLTGLILDGQVWCRQDYDFMSVLTISCPKDSIL